MVHVCHSFKCTLLENGALPWWAVYSLLLNRMTQVCPNKLWHVSVASCKISHLANKQTKIFKINWSFSTFLALLSRKVLDHMLRPRILLLDYAQQHCSLSHALAIGGHCDIWKQRICLYSLSMLHSIFIWRFCHDCMLNWLWTWINCCNLVKGFGDRRWGLISCKLLTCKIAEWLLANPFSKSPFLNCAAINFNTRAVPPCNFRYMDRIRWCRWKSAQ